MRTRSPCTVNETPSLTTPVGTWRTVSMKNPGATAWICWPPGSTSATDGSLDSKTHSSDANERMSNAPASKRPRILHGLTMRPAGIGNWKLQRSSSMPVSCPNTGSSRSAEVTPVWGSRAKMRAVPWPTPTMRLRLPSSLVATATSGSRDVHVTCCVRFRRPRQQVSANGS